MQATRIFLASILAAMLSWETYVIWRHIPNSTISECVWAAIQDRPYLPFFAGILCGHLFWQRSE